MPTLETLKALADETRLRILNILDQSDELCACEIEAVLDLNQSNASRHLARLRAAGLVTARKQGHWVHYTLDASSPHAPLAERALNAAREEHDRLREDLLLLRDYRSSGYSCETIGAWDPEPSGRRIPGLPVE